MSIALAGAFPSSALVVDTPVLSVDTEYMKLYHRSIFALFACLAALLAALHSPGEMSVDSVMALYEAMKGQAVGWGPTFMAATLAWLGGGAVGASIFVALICVLTYGCFAALLVSQSSKRVPRWQIALAVMLSLNPLFMFYVGIIWKDVMQATIAMVAATLLLLASCRSGRSRYIFLGFAIVAVGILVPIRQQGILLAIPMAVAIGWVASRDVQRAMTVRAGVFVGCAVLAIVCSVIFYALSAATVKPQSRGPVSVGIYTIQAYDIAGMIANAKPGDLAAWSDAPLVTQNAIKSHYSSERIDSIWHQETVRNYFNKLSAAQYMSIWLRGIKHDPAAYLKSRLDAFASLLGLEDIKGCVPAFAGIGALPDQVSALGLTNGMNARAHVIGRLAVAIYPTPVFRNWFYALLLLIASVLLLVALKSDARICAGGIAVAAWLYLLSFLPTSIACDVRYLYPVSGLTTALCLFLLTHTSLRRKRERGDGDAAL